MNETVLLNQTVNATALVTKCQGEFTKCILLALILAVMVVILFLVVIFGSRVREFFNMAVHKGRYDRMKEECESLRPTISTLKEQVKDLNQCIELKGKENGRLQEKINDTNKVLESFKRELEDKKAIEEYLEGLHNKFEGILASNNEVLDQTKKKIEERRHHSDQDADEPEDRSDTVGIDNGGY